MKISRSFSKNSSESRSVHGGDEVGLVGPEGDVEGASSHTIAEVVVERGGIARQHVDETRGTDGIGPGRAQGTAIGVQRRGDAMRGVAARLNAVAVGIEHGSRHGRGLYFSSTSRAAIS